jgi:hypothetical protein
MKIEKYESTSVFITEMNEAIKQEDEELTLTNVKKLMQLNKSLFLTDPNPKLGRCLKSLADRFSSSSDYKYIDYSEKLIRKANKFCPTRDGQCSTDGSMREKYMLDIQNALSQKNGPTMMSLAAQWFSEQLRNHNHN